MTVTKRLRSCFSLALTSSGEAISGPKSSLGGSFREQAPPPGPDEKTEARRGRPLPCDAAEPQDLLDAEAARKQQHEEIRDLRDEEKPEERGRRERAERDEQENRRDPRPPQAVESESLREHVLVSRFQERQDRLEKMKAVDVLLPGLRRIHLEEGLLGRHRAPRRTIEPAPRNPPHLVEESAEKRADRPTLLDADGEARGRLGEEVDAEHEDRRREEARAPDRQSVV